MLHTLGIKVIKSTKLNIVHIWKVILLRSILRSKEWSLVMDERASEMA